MKLLLPILKLIEWDMCKFSNFLKLLLIKRNDFI